MVTPFRIFQKRRIVASVKFIRTRDVDVTLIAMCTFGTDSVIFPFRLVIELLRTYTYIYLLLLIKRFTVVTS